MREEKLNRNKYLCKRYGETYTYRSIFYTTEKKKIYLFRAMGKVYTKEMLDFIYNAGKAVYEQGVDVEHFHHQSDEFGITWSSFRRWFVPAFRYLREGIVFKGGLTLAISRYMLERIEQDYGKEGLRCALKSYRGTVEYYDSMGINKPGDRAIIQEFEKHI